MVQKKQSSNFKTPNQKFDEEFAEIGNESATSTQKQKTQSSNFKTPNQKFDEEFKQNDQQ
ncbi:hypothetical protein [Paenibacillus sp. XY044]|uniref:hypothetical protein n=1 Tax=Paenibacillus sp. XY044 TaxID=2026089 RepID=UPI000B98C155|nr:hypothetical protein [Paenibacillus sp. XY044]OZB96368.1 hypothetical protein CJP46_10775 [Paenibacillus sp. XY044]